MVFSLLYIALNYKKLSAERRKLWDDLAGEAANPFQKLTSAQLRDALDTAKHAELEPYDYYLDAGISGNENEHLRVCSLGQADGIWVCCCGRENQLTHYAGIFPFKYVKCLTCDHVVCQMCQNTMIGILQRHPGGREMYKLANKADRVRLCVVCSKCGLSFRAAKLDDDLNPPHSCYCGHGFGPDWPRLRIGTVDEYRQDPIKCAHNAKEKWLQLKVEMHPQ